MSALRVGIVGAGSIGVGFALVFARGGAHVRIFDSSTEMTESVPGRLAERVGVLREFDLLTADAANGLEARISAVGDLATATADADLVLECTPEDIDLKRAVFTRLAEVAASGAILASASSAFGAGEFAEGLAERRRCLVLHPANPPYLVPIVEVVPAEFTDPEVVSRAAQILSDIGMLPVLVRREVTGFVYNRLQGALLREAYCLVRDGVIDVAGLDLIVREGLGPRWSIIGPFETADLNTRGGIAAHAELLGPAYARMGAERGQSDPWTPDLVAEVTAQRRAVLPLEEWEERVLWRDRRLASLRHHLESEPGRRTRVPRHTIERERA